MIAEVILNSNAKDLNRVFDYEIPEDLATKVNIGSRVFVPFGNRKSPEEGFVVNIKTASSYKVKMLQKVDETEYVSKDHIELAKWMAKRYFCNVSDCIKLMLPPGTTTKIVENRVKEKLVAFVNLKKQSEEINEAIEKRIIKSEKQIRALKFLLKNDEIAIADLEVLADVSRAVLNTLQKNGYIEIVEKPVERNPFIHKVLEKSKNLNLTQEQQKAFQTIADGLDDNLYGSRQNRSIFAAN